MCFTIAHTRCVISALGLHVSMAGPPNDYTSLAALQGSCSTPTGAGLMQFVLHAL
jgi:hypothetical protein